MPLVPSCSRNRATKATGRSQAHQPYVSDPGEELLRPGEAVSFNHRGSLCSRCFPSSTSVVVDHGVVPVQYCTSLTRSHPPCSRGQSLSLVRSRYPSMLSMETTGIRPATRPTRIATGDPRPANLPARSCPTRVIDIAVAWTTWPDVMGWAVPPSDQPCSTVPCAARGRGRMKSSDRRGCGRVFSRVWR
jgi:hypothetical protein